MAFEATTADDAAGRTPGADADKVVRRVAGDLDDLQADSHVGKEYGSICGHGPVISSRSDPAGAMLLSRSASASAL
jgi:hypothetical protein